MGRSKKGRLAGGARKEINESRSTEAVSIAFMSNQERVKKSAVLDFVFGRVTKMTGANHVRVAIASKRGPREIAARIPNIYTRRGATPITIRSVVTIHTGPDYNPDGPSIETAMEHFDITSILTDRQVSDLIKSALIPEWMNNTDVAPGASTKDDMGGFIFGEDDEEDEAEPTTDDGGAAGGAGAGDRSKMGTKRTAPTADDDAFNIDDI
jgi:hypothetical protein